MKFIATLLTLGLLVNISSTQISFLDNNQRFPPSPASRRTIVIRNGQLTGQRSAALQQLPDQQLNEQLSQQFEDSAQEVDQPLQEPIVQQPVPTQRPQRVTKPQPVPSRAVNGFPQQQKQQFGQTLDSEEESPFSQRQDSGYTDISLEDVSTEGITPEVTMTSSEEETTDGLTPTEPEQRPVVTTTGMTATQRKGLNGRQKPTNGMTRKTLVTSGQIPVGNGRKGSNGKNGRERQPVVTQIMGGNDGDAQIADDQFTGGQIISGQTSAGDRQTQTGGDTHDEHDHHSGDPIEWLRAAIRGEPGSDYPTFYTPPETSFKCNDQQFPGYYADVEARCQVFHICQSDGRSDAFLCPNGTIFSQQNYVCVWWHDFDCSTAPQLYSLNAQLYSAQETPSEGSTEPLDRTAAQPSGPSRPTTGAVDSIGMGFGDSEDERIQKVEGLQTMDGEEPDMAQQIGRDEPSQQTAVDDSQVISDDITTQDQMTTTPPIRTPNGRPIGGIKGSRRNGGVSTSRVNGGDSQRQSQNGGQRVSVTTTRPFMTKYGVSKKTGSRPALSSPADTARNGRQKSVRTNGANGLQRKKPNGGTKSLFRDRTAQSKELDSQSSNNWYYYLTHL